MEQCPFGAMLMDQCSPILGVLLFVQHQCCWGNRGSSKAFQSHLKRYYWVSVGKCTLQLFRACQNTILYCKPLAVIILKVKANINQVQPCSTSLHVKCSGACTLSNDLWIFEGSAKMFQTFLYAKKTELIPLSASNIHSPLFLTRYDGPGSVSCLPQWSQNLWFSPGPSVHIYNYPSQTSSDSAGQTFTTSNEEKKTEEVYS